MMNQLQEEFYQVMSRLRGSRAASSTTQVPKDDARVTEIINGVIVSKPAKKVTDLSSKRVQEQQESEPEIIDLQEYAKSGKAAASVQGINKVKAIHEFLNRRRY